MGALSPDDLEAAIARQKEDGRKLGEMLVGEERITRDQLARAMAMRMGVGVFTLADGVDPSVGRLIDEKSARRYQAVPVRLEPDGRLLVAMADPSNVFAIDDLRILTRHEIRPALASPEEIQTLLGQTSRLDAVVADLVEESGGDDVPLDQADISETADDAPVVRLVNSLIARAVDERASDIHLEPRPRRWWSATGWTACCARSPRCRTAWRWASRAASRSWPTSTSPSAACRRTGASASPSPGGRSTCASRPCRRCTARRSSCASSTRAT